MSEANLAMFEANPDDFESIFSSTLNVGFITEPKTKRQSMKRKHSTFSASKKAKMMPLAGR